MELFPPRQSLLYKNLALLVVDMQSWFLKRSRLPVGKLANEPLIKNNQNWIDWACADKGCQSGFYVVEMASHKEDLGSTDPLLANVWNGRRAPEVVIKLDKSAYYKTSLSHMLLSTGRKTIVATGLNTNACIAATVDEHLKSGEDWTVLLPIDAHAQLADGLRYSSPTTMEKSPYYIGPRRTGRFFGGLTTHECMSLIAAANMGELAYREGQKTILSARSGALGSGL